MSTISKVVDKIDVNPNDPKQIIMAAVVYDKAESKLTVSIENLCLEEGVTLMHEATKLLSNRFQSGVSISGKITGVHQQINMTGVKA